VKGKHDNQHHWAAKESSLLHKVWRKNLIFIQIHFHKYFETMVLSLAITFNSHVSHSLDVKLYQSKWLKSKISRSLNQSSHSISIANAPSLVSNQPDTFWLVEIVDDLKPISPIKKNENLYSSLSINHFCFKVRVQLFGPSFREGEKKH